MAEELVGHSPELMSSARFCALQLRQFFNAFSDSEGVSLAPHVTHVGSASVGPNCSSSSGETIRLSSDSILPMRSLIAWSSEDNSTTGSVCPYCLSVDLGGPCAHSLFMIGFSGSGYESL